MEVKKMKNVEYKKPIMEIVAWENMDIVTFSGGNVVDPDHDKGEEDIFGGTYD